MRFTSSNTLKIVELKLKSLIERTLENDRTSVSLIQLLSIICVVLFIYLLGIPITSLEQKWLSGTIPGTGVIVGLVLKYDNDSANAYARNTYRRCLSIIEEAQLVTDNIEINPQVPASQNSNNQSNLLENLRKIKLEEESNFNHNL